jgi:hypothetical protein
MSFAGPAAKFAPLPGWAQGLEHRTQRRRLGIESHHNHNPRRSVGHPRVITVLYGTVPAEVVRIACCHSFRRSGRRSGSGGSGSPRPSGNGAGSRGFRRPAATCRAPCGSPRAAVAAAGAGTRDRAGKRTSPILKRARPEVKRYLLLDSGLRGELHGQWAGAPNLRQMLPPTAQTSDCCWTEIRPRRRAGLTRGSGGRIFIHRGE